jgi:hypothetical protein
MESGPSKFYSMFIGPTGKEISWARFSSIFPIGDITNILFKLLQHFLRLWFLPVKWSVSQPLVNPVVGSSQSFFRFLLVFAGISSQLQSFYGINSNHTCKCGSFLCCLLCLPSRHHPLKNYGLFLQQFVYFSCVAWLTASL